MFDVGFFEITLVLLIALLVLGPERLPGLARTIGTWVRRARRMVSGIRDEIDKELSTEDWKREIDRQREQLRDIRARLEGQSGKDGEAESGKIGEGESRNGDGS